MKLHADPEACSQMPGKTAAVDRTGCFSPAVERVLVQRPEFAVLVGAGDVQDGAVGMQVRVAGAALTVLPHPRYDVGEHHFLTVSAMTGGGAVTPHGELERVSGRIVVGALDVGAELRPRDGPERGDALVGAEGEVEAGGAVLLARVLRELVSRFG